MSFSDYIGLITAVEKWQKKAAAAAGGISSPNAPVIN